MVLYRTHSSQLLSRAEEDRRIRRARSVSSMIRPNYDHWQVIDEFKPALDTRPAVQWRPDSLPYTTYEQNKHCAWPSAGYITDYMWHQTLLNPTWPKPPRWYYSDSYFYSCPYVSGHTPYSAKRSTRPDYLLSNRSAYQWSRDLMRNYNTGNRYWMEPMSWQRPYGDYWDMKYYTSRYRHTHMKDWFYF